MQCALETVRMRLVEATKRFPSSLTSSQYVFSDTIAVTQYVSTSGRKDLWGIVNPGLLLSCSATSDGLPLSCCNFFVPLGAMLTSSPGSNLNEKSPSR